MVFTYFIGNGFDLNIGLQTSYDHFLDYYLKDVKEKPEDDAPVIDRLKYYIKDSRKKDIINWSNAEMAFGDATVFFKDSDDYESDFILCKDDFCSALCDYLKMQNKRLSNIALSEKQKSKVSVAIGDIIGGLKTDSFRTISKAIRNENVEINIVSFNYTDSIDSLTKDIRNVKNVVDMVFGVHDDSQVAFPEMFENNDILRAQIIKEEINHGHENGVEEDVKRIVESSDIIYIYGMSLGETDNRWWQRIMEMMRSKKNAQLIVYDYETPEISISAYTYQKNRQIIRSKLLSFCDQATETEKNELASRIYLDPHDKFDMLANIVPK